MNDLLAWHRYWLIWACVAFATFLGPEIYGLVTDPRRTLSAAIWYWERLQSGQAISGWTAFHFLFIGVFLVLTVWLLFHFGFGWFR